MICKMCKTENKENAKFCVNCGEKLTEKKVKPVKEEKVEKVETATNPFLKKVISSLEDIKNSFLRPLDSMKNKHTEDIEHVAITGVILAFVMMFVHLIRTMFSSIRVMEFDWIKGRNYVWNFENLKELNYFKLIVENFLIYALIILGIALIFYLGILVIKKQVSYQKILSMVLVSMIPFILGNIILAGIVGMFSTSFALMIMTLSTIYAISIFVILLNQEVKFTDQEKLYFYTVCFSILIFVSYFLVSKVMVPGLNNLLG